MSKRENVNSYFSGPETLNIPSFWGISYWFSSDELDLYYTDYNDVFYTHRNALDEPFATPVGIELNGFPQPDVWDAISLNSNQTELFIQWNNAEIYYVIEYEGIWPSYNFKRILPAPDGYKLTGGQLSKDDLVYFTGAFENDGKWMLYQLTRPSTLDTFDITTFSMIEGINDTNTFNAFPSMSDSLEWVAFNRSIIDWYGLDLYLAHKGIQTQVFDPENPPIFSYAFPNPASEILNIKYKSAIKKPIVVYVYSNTGELVYKNDLILNEGLITLNSGALYNGLYFYSLIQSKGKSIRNASGKFIIKH